MSWFNSDKLLLKFGTEKTVPTTGGDFRKDGPSRIAEFYIDMTKLTTTSAIINDVTVLGKSLWIESVEIDVEEAAAVGTTVSIGLYKQDRTTAIDETGILNAEVTATLTLGKKIVYDASTTKHGTLVGTVTAFPGLFSAKITGSTFTTGKLRVRVNYRRLLQP